MNFVGTHKPLTLSDFKEASDLTGIPVATLRGVTEVEARGSGYDSKSRPKILTEPHIFYQKLSGNKRAQAVKQGLAYPKWGAKPYPKTSQLNYDRLEKMMAIDETAALESTSWGLFQIMGFNYKSSGYSTVQEMVRAFVDNGEKEHLLAFLRLIDAWKLENALRNRDAVTFARKFNGPGYAKNRYHTKLSEAWKKYDSGKAIPSSKELDTQVRVPAPKEKQVTTTKEEINTYHEKPTIVFVQNRLRELGYYEVGMADGNLDSFTVSAICAFRYDNELPVVPEIDAELLKKLAVASPRELGQARSKATPSEVRQKVPEAQTSHYAKVIAAITGLFSTLTAAFWDVIKNLQGAKDYLTPVGDFLSDIPAWAYLIVIAIVALVVANMARKSEVSSIKAFQSGERR
jgi:hypothetical protein